MYKWWLALEVDVSLVSIRCECERGYHKLGYQKKWYPALSFSVFVVFSWGSQTLVERMEGREEYGAGQTCLPLSYYLTDSANRTRIADTRISRGPDA